MNIISNGKRAITLGILMLLPLPVLAGYSEGMDCYKNKDYDCMIREFTTEIQAHPNYDFGWFMIGIAYLQKKEYAKAVENLNKAIEFNGQKLSYHLNKAKAYTDQQKYDAVIQTLTGKEAMANTAMETYSLNYQLGTANHQTKKHKDAIPYLEKAVAVKPDYTTFYMLGISYLQAGNVDKSLSTLKDALKQKPGDSDVQAQLARSYLGLAQRETKDKAKKAQYYAEAVSYASKSVKTAASDVSKNNVLAKSYLGARQYDNAEAAFKKVLQLDSKQCYAQTNLGKVYNIKKEWSNAVAALEKATKCDAKSSPAWDSLGFAQEKIAKGLDTDQKKIAQLNKSLGSFKKAASISSSQPIQTSIERVQNNIEIAQQNIRIAHSNVRTMETNLSNLQRSLKEGQAVLQKLIDTRQFFLDKGNWPDEKEEEFKKEKEQLEKDLATLEKRIKDQEDELELARAAANPT